ncbi:hypothetical protein CGZ95_12800 [Enemella evansiae]|uniref:hypothetical protein n=1 Tax=Enemella evansiae TaxID=2016499 RepID=UPI000B97B045|nr:hypothetical protein [Enemella evansiae]OYN98088.1 hypothetical protein CGZ95_12800 [Enemella evansiae]
MNPRTARTRIRRRFAATAAAATALALGCGPFGATSALAEGPVSVTNTETVQAYLNPDGTVTEARIYEQVAMEGRGRIDLANPVATEGLRNLDGFTDLPVRDGRLAESEQVDGQKRLRTVSNWDKGKLPLSVRASYFLDGKQVTANQVVGRSGELEVRYRVENITGREQTFTVDDGAGGKATRTERVVVPFVGQLQTTLPPGFTDVRSGEANMAGDGRGGTKLSYTMTLFGPIGAPTAEFGYRARISEGVIPPASLSGLPVNPLQSPSFKGGAASYAGGAESGRELANGAAKIDENLIKLRDGANTLVAGLLQLRDGSQQLKDGTAKAKDGTRQLANGAGELDNGANQIDQGAGKLDNGAKQLDNGARELDNGANQLNTGAKQLNTGAGALNNGATQLDDGASRLKDGTGQLVGGVTQIRDGLDKIDAGLVQMYGKVGELPNNPGLKELYAGIQKLKDGIGSQDDPKKLLGGLTALQKQLNDGGNGLLLLDKKIYRQGATKEESGAYQKINCAVQVINQLNNGGTDFDDYCYGEENAAQLKAAGLISGLPESNPVKKQIMTNLAAELAKGRDQLADPDNLGDPRDSSYIDGPKPDPNTATLQQALSYIGGRITNRAVPGIDELLCGLDNTATRSSGKECPKVDSSGAAKPGLQQGLGLVDNGVQQLVNGVVSQVQQGIGHPDQIAADAARENPATLRGGMRKLQGGGAQLADGAGKLDDGAGQLADGTGRLRDGTGQLVDGSGRLSDGTGKLVDGTGRLTEGTGQLSDGTGQLADGTGRLVDGTGRLVTGSGDLDRGMGQIDEGAGKVADGTKQAAEKAPAIPDGANQLHEQGSSKILDAGKKTAVDYGVKYAALQAGAQRADAEAMPVGAPQGAIGLTAYSLEIRGADGADGASLGRGLLGALLLVGAGVATVLAKRRLS